MAHGSKRCVVSPFLKKSVVNLNVSATEILTLTRHSRKSENILNSKFDYLIYFSWTFDHVPVAYVSEWNLFSLGYSQKLRENASWWTLSFQYFYCIHIINFYSRGSKLKVQPCNSLNYILIIGFCNSQLASIFCVINALLFINNHHNNSKSGSEIVSHIFTKIQLMQTALSF